MGTAYRWKVLLQSVTSVWVPSREELRFYRHFLSYTNIYILLPLLKNWVDQAPSIYQHKRSIDLVVTRRIASQRIIPITPNSWQLTHQVEREHPRQGNARGAAKLDDFCVRLGAALTNHLIMQKKTGIC